MTRVAKFTLLAVAASMALALRFRASFDALAPIWGAAPAVAQNPVDPQSYGASQGATQPYNQYQMRTMAPLQPASASRPAGWPGGPPAEEPPPARGGRPGDSRAVSPGARVASASPPWRLPNTQPADDAERPMQNTDIIARVGTEVILAGDVLYDVNKTMEKVLSGKDANKYTPEQIAAGRKALLKQFVMRNVETKLVFIEARRKIPAEQLPKVETHFNEYFDKSYLKKMLESEGVRSRTELEVQLRKAGTTYEALRRQAFESNTAGQWLSDNVKDKDEITHDEMREYYRAHIADYETPPRARWEHLMARFSKFDSNEEAWQALAQWGNLVVQGTPLAEVAKAHSQDASASDGGVHGWTNQGSLVSTVLDDAIFNLPVGSLSRILEDERGYHIIRVVERNELDRSPFTEAQVEIKKKIREERVADHRKEYLESLRKRTATWTIFDDKK